MSTTSKQPDELSYRTMTLDIVHKRFRLHFKRVPLFTHVEPIAPSAWLTETLSKGMALALISEKARAEFVVAPILLEVRALCQDAISIYSGVCFDVDPANGLKGVCDFIVSKTLPVPTLQAPVVVLVEAKKNDIEEGLGQCAAEMLAARIFNEREQNAIDTIFGCVTTGEDWQFLKLQADTLYIDESKLFISELPKILGTLKLIVENQNA